MDAGDWPERRIRRVRVLVVDDEEDFRTLMRRRLESDGRFEVVGDAQDGTRALALMDVTRPDVVLLDLTMPGVDGLEIIKALRRHHPDVKCVVLSGTDAMEAAEEATRLGAYAYLEKGTSQRQIMRVLAPLAPPEFE